MESQKYMAARLQPVKVVGLWNGRWFDWPVGGAGFWTKREDTRFHLFQQSDRADIWLEFHVQQNSNEKRLNILGLLLFGDVFFLAPSLKQKKASKNIFLVYLFVITGTHSEIQ